MVSSFMKEKFSFFFKILGVGYEIFLFRFVVVVFIIVRLVGYIV